MRCRATFLLAALLLSACGEDRIVVARRLGETGREPAGGSGTDDTAAYLFVLLDQSGTMGDGVNGDPALRWDPTTNALKRFFAAPPAPKLQASLTFFPPDIFKNKTLGVAASPQDTNASICDVGTYLEAQVRMTPLPDQASFAVALDAVTPPNERGTPTAPALRGALAQAEALLERSPGAPTNVVVITDGVPGQCELIEEARAAAERAYPAIATYIVVVGSDAEALDQLAIAGGTEQAIFVPVGDPAVTEASVLRALTDIQARAQAR